MKKEIFIGCFLVLMLAAAIVNIHFLTKLTDNVVNLIEDSEKYAGQGDWETAEKKAEEAARLWSDSDTYTHLVLRHPEVETAMDAIYGFMEEIYAKEEGAAKGAAEAAISRMQSISAIEQIKIGSIF
ncbi:protein of unknown function [Sporobacter termitidis DSM 10068]|uniref:DUF4363 family protein n=1 Tax=Sporobacter termitidis DSM 10068 TaxID=1123282 RepID=A0A1M5TSZ9_9FIRM|nr:DUF4363 family protein [Sporobacter termitidis]SHH53839.1 protein of unknown function [Sporobacter termitidis DSM 10068]